MGVDPLDHATTEHRQRFQAAGVGLRDDKGLGGGGGRDGRARRRHGDRAAVGGADPGARAAGVRQAVGAGEGADAMWASETATAFASGEPPDRTTSARCRRRRRASSRRPRCRGRAVGSPAGRRRRSPRRRARDAFTASSRANLSGAACSSRTASPPPPPSTRRASRTRRGRPQGHVHDVAPAVELGVQRADMQQQRVARRSPRASSTAWTPSARRRRYVAARFLARRRCTRSLHAVRGDGSHRYIEIVPPKA